MNDRGIRKFSSRGVERFREVLARIREGAAIELAAELAWDAEFTEPVHRSADVDPASVAGKLQLARHLERAFTDAGIIHGVLDDPAHVNTWTWLACRLLPILISPGAGARVPVDHKFVYEPGYSTGVRHLVRTPLYVHRTFGANGHFLLLGATWEHGDMLEQVLQRKELHRPECMRVAKELFWDDSRSTLKPHAVANIARFGKVFKQIGEIYAVNCIDAALIRRALPERDVQRWEQGLKPKKSSPKATKKGKKPKKVKRPTRRSSR
jgi:hypothetical protein